MSIEIANMVQHISVYLKAQQLEQLCILCISFKPCIYHAFLFRVLLVLLGLFTDRDLLHDAIARSGKC